MDDREKHYENETKKWLMDELKDEIRYHRFNRNLPERFDLPYRKDAFLFIRALKTQIDDQYMRKQINIHTWLKAMKEWADLFCFLKRHEDALFFGEPDTRKPE